MNWVYDLETRRWSIALVSCAVCSDGRKLAMFSPGHIRAWFRILKKNDIVWAHNGGKFDFLYLLRVIGGKWKILSVGGRIIAAVHASGVSIRDTFAICPIKLSDTGHKSEFPCACECGRKCGGYCALDNREPTPAELQKITEYCFQDCIATLNMLDRWAATCEAIGLDYKTKSGFRLTMGSIAWNTAWKLAGKPVIRTDDFRLDSQCYYGGRVEVYQTSYAGTVHTHDIRSSYPAALKGEYPIDEYLYKADIDLEGWSKVTVKVPDGLSGLLPVKGKSRIWYPVNSEMTGVWCNNELRYAVSMGAIITKQYGGRCWPKTTPLWRPYIEMVYNARNAALLANDKMISKWLKLQMNSLYGKFGQDPSREEWIYDLPQDGYHQVLETEDGYTYQYKEKYAISPCCGPIHAAMTTASGRITLHRRMNELGESLVYSDTDSTVATEYVNTGEGDNLGEWHYEGENKQWECVAPKVYWTEGKMRAKGFPAALELDWARISNGLAYSTLRPPTLRGGWHARTLTRRVRTNETRIGARIRTHGALTRAPLACETDYVASGNT